MAPREEEESVDGLAAAAYAVADVAASSGPPAEPEGEGAAVAAGERDLAGLRQKARNALFWGGVSSSAGVSVHFDEDPSCLH